MNQLYFFFFLVSYYCILMLKLFLSSRLWRYAAVGCCIADCWFVHWCTDVSWEYQISEHNAAVLLHNNIIRNDRLLHRGAQLVHQQGSRVLHLNLCCSELYHQRSRVIHRSSQVLHHQVTGVLHECCPSVLHQAVQVLHHQGSRFLH